jgi:hypothetical protein
LWPPPFPGNHALRVERAKRCGEPWCVRRRDPTIHWAAVWGGVMWRLVAVAAALTLFVAAAPAGAQEQTQEPTVRRAIESVLEMDTGRAAPRLPRVTLDVASGDLTVIFAMRRPGADDPAQIVASATDDVFTILAAAYSSAASPRIRTATVIGTYAVSGRYERPREIPLLRAVLSAEKSAAFDWTTAATADPRDVFDVWWVESELVVAGGQ